jgi:hypothetical protein
MKRHTPETETRLAQYDPQSDTVKKQITAIIPYRNAWPETQKNRTAAEVRMRDRTAWEIFVDDDGLPEVRRDDRSPDIVAQAIAQYRYTVQHGHWADLGAGLYTMVTNDACLYDYFVNIKRDRHGNERITSFTIITSLQTLFKATFGPLLHDNGRAIHGAGDIVESGKRQIMGILTGQIPEPHAYTSINRRYDDGSQIRSVIRGKPITLYQSISGERDAVALDLDCLFYPISERRGGGLKTDDLFLHTVAGLTSVLQFGAKLHRLHTGERAINADIARRIILSAQAAYELGRHSTHIVKTTRSGRVNIAIKREAVRELYPAAVDSTGWIRFKQFSDAVAAAGQCYRHALEATGIMDTLAQRDDILIPATEKGAEFPEDRPGVVYIKADTAKRLIS